VLKNGGTAWGPVMDAVSGKGDYLARRRDQMLADGLIINVGKGQRFVLWHRDDPARPALDLAVSLEGKGWEKVDSPPGDEGEVPTFSRFPPVRETEKEKVGTASPGASESVDDEEEEEAAIPAALRAEIEAVGADTYDDKLRIAVEQHIAANGPSSVDDLLPLALDVVYWPQAVRVARHKRKKGDPVNERPGQVDRDIFTGTEKMLRATLDAAAKQGTLIRDKDGRWRPRPEEAS
jgi:hypothetical protein